MAQECLDMFRTELAGMAPLVKPDESPYSIRIGGLGPNAVVLQANLVADTVEE